MCAVGQQILIYCFPGVQYGMSLFDILISIAVCGAAMLLLSIRVIAIKNGRFSRQHACKFNKTRSSINEQNPHKTRLTEQKNNL